MNVDKFRGENVILAVCIWTHLQIAWASEYDQNTNFRR